jgi:tripartite motif-containing protein 71
VKALVRGSLLTAVVLGMFLAFGSAAGSTGVSFSQPASVAVDRAGNVYVADVGSHHILKLSPTGALLGTWTGRRLHLQANGPFGTALAVDGRANLDVLDGQYPAAGPNRQDIVRLSPSGRMLAQWSNPQLHDAVALAAGENSLFVAELTVSAQGFPRGRIVKFSLGGKPVSSWPIGRSGYQKVEPFGLALDGHGTLYLSAGAGPCSRGCQGLATFILERYSVQGRLLGMSRIPLAIDAIGPGLVAAGGTVYTAGDIHLAKVSSGGTVQSAWGAAGCGALQFQGIAGLARGGRGNLFVADGVNRNVQKISPAGHTIAIWGGCPSGPPPPLTPTAVP